MSHEKELNIDDILSKLDQNSRKARIISIAFTIFSVIILIGLLYLTYQANENLTLLNAEVEEKQKLANQENIRFKDIKEKNDSLEEGFQKIADVQKSNTTCEEQKTATEQTLTQVSNITGVDLTQVKPAATPAPSVSKDLEGIKKVYIQIVDEAQRSDAITVSKALRSKGLNVPGIELVKALNGKIGQTQVRYFNKEDEARAQKLAEQLALLKITNAKPVFTQLPAETGQLEIWFANSTVSKN